ncbi:MAG: DUF2867 domain-containing protein [Pseudomonadota bacterium]
MPAETALDQEFVEEAFFIDSYQISLTHGSATVVDIFFAVFGHHPAWLKAVLLVRHRVGAWFGLQAASTSEVMSPRRAASYRVGQHIGPWSIYFLGDRELVAGRDNKHLDFRLSVFKRGSGPSASAVVSTVCRTHNRFGRMYLRTIAPFHQWGVQRLLRRAGEAGRL